MKEKNISAFKEDVINRSGYIYTKTNKVSCRYSIDRSNQAIYQVIGSVKGKKIIDVGCGDGTFTKEFIAMGPEHVLGIDPNTAGIELAKKNTHGIKNISFEVMDIYTLPIDKNYDVAILRGVLHHLYQVEKAIERICKIAKKIIVIEPNGYNPVLKLIEKNSPYHVKHEEKSYFPKKLDQWFINNGGVIVDSFYIGLVPIFFPDSLAKILKFIEPYVEKTPGLRNIACGQYVQEIHITR